MTGAIAVGQRRLTWRMRCATSVRGSDQFARICSSSSRMQATHINAKRNEKHNRCRRPFAEASGCSATVAAGVIPCTSVLFGGVFPICLSGTIHHRSSNRTDRDACKKCSTKTREGKGKSSEWDGKRLRDGTATVPKISIKSVYQNDAAGRRGGGGGVCRGGVLFVVVSSPSGSSAPTASAAPRGFREQPSIILEHIPARLLLP